MKKKFMRMAATVLAALLVVTTVNPLAIEVSAAESADSGVSKTYTIEELGNAGSFVYDASDLEIINRWDTTVDQTDGNYDVSFEKRFSQLFLKFPDGITADRLISVSVEADKTDLSLKLVTNDEEYPEAAVVYGQNAITLNTVKDGINRDDICILGIMNLKDGSAVKSIGKITFVLGEKVEANPAPEAGKTVVTDAAGVYTFKPADLETVAVWDSEIDSADGKYDIKFAKQFAQVFYKFPEGVTAERINSVSVDADATEFCVKLSANRNNFVAGAERFGALTVNLDSIKNGVEKDEICIVGLMNTSEGEAVKSIKSISFDLKAKTSSEENKPVEDQRVFTYKLTDLAVATKWGTDIIPVDENSVKVTFEKQHSQLFLTIPENIDPRRIIEAKVEADSSNFSVKFCKADSSHTELGVVYGNNTIKDSNLQGDPAEIGEIALMNLLDGANEKVVGTITIKLGDPVVDDPNAPVKGDLTVDCFKSADNSNPIVTQRYSADPGVMVYGDTVYVYSTNDIYQYAGKKLGENTYSKITTINCFSSKDLVNWTDHGAIPVAGKQNPDGAAKWANNSWAPCAAHKTIDGKEKFFLYFADNGSGIGVLTSDSPTGPFVDPLGKQLVSRQTPTCNTVEWLFDPAVFVDDDGTGYLYFGGGVPSGKEADPGTARVVKLGDDMISLAGDPVQINPPYLFEDSGINKIGDKYYYSYCSNFDGGSNFKSGTIHYMVSDNPMGPFTYVSDIFANPSSFFNDGNGNNHHSLFEFNGKLYIAYHARALEKLAVGSALGYRTTQLDEVTVTDGKINRITGTMKGVAQTTTLNPYVAQKATTIFRQKGVEVFGSGDTVLTVTEGDFTGVKGVNFNAGAASIEMTVKASAATTVDVLVGSEKGTKVGTIAVSDTNGEYAVVKADLENINGVNDLYFVFNGALEAASWKVNSAMYSLDDLQSMGGYGFKKVADENGKTIALEYEKQYQEARFAIPESILEAGIKKIEVVTDDASNLSIKSIDASGAQVEVNYGQKVLDITNKDGVVGLALMNKEEGVRTINVTGIKFVTEEAKAPVVQPEDPKPGETPAKPLIGTLVYEAKDLNMYYRWNTSTKPENGVMTFPSNYYEFCADLPEEINAADIESIKVNVTDQTGSLAIKVYNTTATGNGDLDNTTPCKFDYAGATSYDVSVPTEGVVASFGFMSHKDDAPFSATLKSIEITLKKKAIVLGAEELSGLVNPWNGSDVQGPTLNYNSRYQEYGYIFEEAISTDNIESVVVNVKDQGGQICVKFYGEATSEWFHDYNVVGNTEYTFTPEPGNEIKKIAFMSMPDPDVEGNYPYSVTIESVVVNLKAGSSTEKQEETYVYEGESLNFREHWGEDSQPIGNKLTFEKRWDEYVIDLGREIDMERVKSLKIKVSGQENEISFKVYADPAKDSEDQKDVELKADYGKKGSTTYAFPAAEGIATKFAVMAQAEETEGVYPYSVTIENVTIVYDTAEREVVDKGVEEDIINLRDAVKATMGDDFLIGTAMSYDEFGDENDIALALKHFNAITLGNELKPDTILGSSHGELKKVTLNGVEFDFPELKYSTPESRLDVILKYNNEHPDDQIKVRGHVLVWHSQMPTWFFREGYVSNGAYVSKEEMNLRLEYYIKTVSEHFTGADSKYKGMFYGWDVVNEAVSDGGGYRKDFNGKTTDWWAIYGSQEFICNAFVYANRYMDPSVELYYNDYNDTMAGKVASIEQLLRDVKATPGARIDAFGMQAHYDMNSPSAATFMDAARKYAAIVGAVQVTELDFKGSSGPKDEKLTQRYLDIYNSIRRLREDGVKFTAMTIWGVTDKHSWLQSQNNVGGGSTSNAKQYPLLFDNNYKAKGAFWAIAEAGELAPEEKTVTLVKAADDKFSAGVSYTFKSGDGLVEIVPEVYDENSIRIKVVSPDKSVDATDKVTVYYAYGDEAGSVVATGDSLKRTENGYEAVLEFAVDYEAIKANKLIFDVVVNNNGKQAAFGDTRLKQTIENTYYAKTIFKNSEKITKGTAVVDGKGDDKAWEDATELGLAINATSNASATAKLVWDEEKLYILATVKDAVLDATASADHEKDSIEIFIDENNHKSGSYEDDDKQYRVNYENVQTFNGKKCLAENIESAVTVTEDGYVIEAAIKWTDIEAKDATSVGFDIQVNDAEGGKRVGTLNWADNSGNGWSSPAVFGTIVLVDKKSETPVNPGTNPSENPSTGNTDVTAPTTDNKTEEAAPTVTTPATTTSVANESYVRPQETATQEVTPEAANDTEEAVVEENNTSETVETVETTEQEEVEEVLGAKVDEPTKSATDSADAVKPEEKKNSKLTATIVVFVALLAALSGGVVILLNRKKN